uniref:Uncharacterized protein n=1 Tax=mine drainage metagenome TaxID=410659 RepID=E6QVU9_9ZZZZ
MLQQVWCRHHLMSSGVVGPSFDKECSQFNDGEDRHGRNKTPIAAEECTHCHEGSRTFGNSPEISSQPKGGFFVIHRLLLAEQPA